MTIAYANKGTTATANATSMDIPLPTGYAADDLLLAYVTSYPDTQTPSTPSGWTQAVTQTGGGGTGGTDTGPRRITVFYKVATSGSETTPTTTQTSATGSLMHGRCWYLTRSAGSGWDIDSVSGSDDSVGTDYSVTASAAVTGDIASGDLVCTFTATQDTTNVATGGTATLTATGATISAQTNIDNLETSLGYHARTDTKHFSITAGSSSSAPVYACTFDASTSGATAFIRLRELTGTDATVGATSVSSQASIPGFTERNALVVMGGESKQGVWA